MRIGMIGLGRMGANMVRRLMRDGHEVVVFDLNPDSVKELGCEGAITADSMDEFVQELASPRVAWIMVPAGNPVQGAVDELAQRMDKGDIIIDGGNSYYKDDVRRSEAVAEKGIHYLDVGTSGGVWGIDRGYCMMIGGEKSAFDHVEPIFQTLAPGKGDVEPTPGRTDFSGTADQGYSYCGPSGAGHFVKMVHNGIEYGLMQAYAEGFDILKTADSESLPANMRYDFDLAEIAEVWRRGSVVGSWLLDLTATALAEDNTLANYTGFVSDSGEGRWTIMAAVEQAVPAEVLSASLYARFRSRQEHTFGEKVLSAMREKFGGHVEQAAATS